MQDYQEYAERRRLAVVTFEGAHKLYEDNVEVNFDNLYNTADPAKQWTTNAKGEKVHTFK